MPLRVKSLPWLPHSRKPKVVSERSEAARVEHWDYKLEGWPVFQAARPNATHQAIVRLERAGTSQGQRHYRDQHMLSIHGCCLLGEKDVSLQPSAVGRQPIDAAVRMSVARMAASRHPHRTSNCMSNIRNCLRGQPRGARLRLLADG